ncbi:hypothetical protein BMS3Bbin02_00232 [bacterium BMS3Bbin02]|nr:hypothetical protein BMS3Bbin02_00232 [bacterium BMS3Bbin02]
MRVTEPFTSGADTMSPLGPTITTVPVTRGSVATTTSSPGSTIGSDGVRIGTGGISSKVPSGDDTDPSEVEVFVASWEDTDDSELPPGEQALATSAIAINAISKRRTKILPSYG